MEETEEELRREVKKKDRARRPGEGDQEKVIKTGWKVKQPAESCSAIDKD